MHYHRAIATDLQLLKHHFRRTMTRPNYLEVDRLQLELSSNGSAELQLELETLNVANRRVAQRQRSVMITLFVQYLHAMESSEISNKNMCIRKCMYLCYV